MKTTAVTQAGRLLTALLQAGNVEFAHQRRALLEAGPAELKAAARNLLGDPPLLGDEPVEECRSLLLNKLKPWRVRLDELNCELGKLRRVAQPEHGPELLELSDQLTLLGEQVRQRCTLFALESAHMRCLALKELLAPAVPAAAPSRRLRDLRRSIRELFEDHERCPRHHGAQLAVQSPARLAASAGQGQALFSLSFVQMSMAIGTSAVTR